MKSSVPREETKWGVSRFSLAMALIWTAAAALSLLWNLAHEKEQIEQLAVTTARINFEKDIIYRSWGTAHGGVYAPVSELTRPNPFLSHVPERDIVTPSGKQLTLINPAYMLRQVYEFAKEKSIIRGHITSLNPLNPANRPDPWEAEALEAFEQGATERSVIMNMDGESYMRIMRPFKTEKGCLKCHESQGYREGDIRGGVSVSIPMAPLWHVHDKHIGMVWIGHSFIWLMGLIGITLGWRRTDRSLTRELELRDELARSEQRFRILSESSPIGIFQNDSEGQCLYTNPRWQTIAGLTSDQSLGEGWAVALHPADREKVLFEWRRCVMEGEEYIGDFRFLRFGREIRWVRVRAAGIRTEEGKISGFVGTVADITELLAAQEELTRTRKAESINVLAGGVAHDFNNLLGVIVGNIDLARMHLEKESEAAKPLGEACRAALQARSLTKQFLLLSSGEELSKSPTRLEGLLLKAADAVLADSDIEVRSSFADNLRCANVDAVQINTVFYSLIHNAREAMPEGGVLTLHAANADILRSQVIDKAFLNPGEYVKISIQDEGVGIPEEYLERIFDPYFSTKGRYNQKGMGFSLAIVQTIIRKHGGHIGVESKSKNGTIFHVYLPALPEEQKAPAHRSRASD